jgi:SAM-dependent methyltransferase
MNALSSIESTNLAQAFSSLATTTTQSNFARFREETDLLARTLIKLPREAVVIDYGCYNWLVSGLARDLGRTDLNIVGVDPYGEPPGRPGNAKFMMLPRPGASLPISGADLLVAANVLEHCNDGVAVFGTWVEAVRPGGLIYVEAPSEDTLLMASDPDVEGQAYKSFWDDPTHVRPWPPAALYRLALSWGARPEQCFYAMCAGNHSGVSLTRRIDPEPPQYRYVSLRDVPRGVDAALRHSGSMPAGRYLGG